MNHKTNTENKPAKANNKKASQQRMNDINYVQSILLTRHGLSPVPLTGTMNPLLPVITAFEIYHGLKFGAATIVDEAFASGNHYTVYSKAAAFARVSVIKFK